MSERLCVSSGIRPTRFASLGYRCDGHGLWRIYDVDDRDSMAAVGPFYRTKAELLADLERYASEYGCPETSRPTLAEEFSRHV